MTHPYPEDPPRPTPPARRNRRRRTYGIIALVLLLAGGGYAGHQLLAGGPESTDPRVTAAMDRLKPFLGAWQRGQAKQAGTYTDSPKTAESLLTSVMTNLAPTRTKLTAGDGEPRGEDEVQVPFTVAMDIPGVGEYTWHSRARLRERSGKWTVLFSTPTLHPELRPGQTLALSSLGGRAKILDGDGGELEAASLTGMVDEKSGKGVSGLQARYDARLTGGKGPRKAVVVADRQSGHAVGTLAGAKAHKGRAVRTTIDPRVQRAAADALSGVDKTAAIVAVDPRDGHILAAANKPGGMNRALAGRYPPGSTFKVVTTAALLSQGLGPDDPASCPKFTASTASASRTRTSSYWAVARRSGMFSRSPATPTSSAPATSSPTPRCGTPPGPSASAGTGTRAPPRTTVRSRSTPATTTRPPPSSARRGCRPLPW